MSKYNYTKGERGKGFRRGNPGKPKGVKHKYSLNAVEQMVACGFDPIDAYLDLLERAREAGNLIVEERILSRLMPFRFPTLHHSLLTNMEDSDLKISLIKFAETGSANDPKSGEELEDRGKGHPNGDNVVSIEREKDS